MPENFYGGFDCWQKQFDSDILTQAFMDTQAYIDEAYNSHEQFLSPHYCFLFCLVLFLCDEIVVYSNSYAVLSWVSMFLAAFITYSYILLSAIWILYITRFGLWRKAGAEMQFAAKEGIIHFDKRKAFSICISLLFVMIYLLFGRTFIMNSSFDIQWQSFVFIVVMDIVLLGMPVCYVYAIHEMADNLKYRSLSYSFTFVHFMFGGILSLAICAVISKSGLSITPNLLHIPSDGFIKWGSIVLIVLFGLVCPSYLPYAVFCKAEKNAEKLINSKNQIIDKESKDLLSKIRTFNSNH